ncbi:MAG TPA: hypothetical protein VFM18_22310 [Methanosarcina sp.]|nr:hypothetical protein [Methanosarcina sp.]
MKNGIDDYYLLSELCGDDYDIISVLIHRMRPKEERTKPAYIVVDLEDGRIDKYLPFMSIALDLPHLELRDMICSIRKEIIAKQQRKAIKAQKLNEAIFIEYVPYTLKKFKAKYIPKVLIC